MQVQCRGFMESMHQECLLRLTKALEQETWVIASVPHDVQATVSKFVDSTVPNSDGVHNRLSGTGCAAVCIFDIGVFELLPCL